MKRCKPTWAVDDNQNPESWQSRVLSWALQKVMGEGKNKKKLAEQGKPCDYSNESQPIWMK